MLVDFLLFFDASYLLVCKKWPEQIINEDAEPAAAAAAADLPHALALPPKAEAAIKPAELANISEATVDHPEAEGAGQDPVVVVVAGVPLDVVVEEAEEGDAVAPRGKRKSPPPPRSWMPLWMTIGSSLEIRSWHRRN